MEFRNEIREGRLYPILICLLSISTSNILKGVSASVCYREYIADKGKCSKEVTSPLNGTTVDGYQECCRLPDAKGWMPNRKNSLCIPCVKIVDGSWGDWTPWTVCPVTCDWGERLRKRKCDNPKRMHGGKDCIGTPLETERCYSGVRCSVHGNWSSWGKWGRCSKTCLKGIRFRYRSCDSPEPDFGGRDCQGPSEHGENCIENFKCPVNGNWGAWSAWSSCSKTCEVGRMTRKRRCNNPEPKYGGRFCKGTANETFPCQMEERCTREKPVKPTCKESSSSGLGAGESDNECGDVSESGSGSDTILRINGSDTVGGGVEETVTSKPTKLVHTVTVTPQGKIVTTVKQTIITEEESGSGSEFTPRPTKLANTVTPQAKVGTTRERTITEEESGSGSEFTPRPTTENRNNNKTSEQWIVIKP